MVRHPQHGSFPERDTTEGPASQGSRSGLGAGTTPDRPGACRPVRWLGLAAGLAWLTGCSVTYVIHDHPEDAYPTPTAFSLAPSTGTTTVTYDLDTRLVLSAGISDPGPNYIWVDVVVLNGEVCAPGFWRLRTRSGYLWVNGYWDGDRYIPGYWRPRQARGSSWVWAPGHWAGKYWIEGHWRPARRSGYQWEIGHWDRSGNWHDGHWRPVTQRPDREWVPGYWLPGDKWKEGYWRPRSRDGFVWVPGYFNGSGRWVEGGWQAAPPKHYWAPGYWDPNGGFTPGRMVPEHDGEAPAPGHYGRDSRWVPDRVVPQTEVGKRHEDAAPQPTQVVPDPDGSGKVTAAPPRRSSIRTPGPGVLQPGSGKKHEEPPTRRATPRSGPGSRTEPEEERTRPEAPTGGERETGEDQGPALERSRKAEKERLEHPGQGSGNKQVVERDPNERRDDGSVRVPDDGAVQEPQVTNGRRRGARTSEPDRTAGSDRSALRSAPSRQNVSPDAETGFDPGPGTDPDNGQGKALGRDQD